jgi:hypothetical protein
VLQTLTSCHYPVDWCCAAACCKLGQAVTSLRAGAAQPCAANFDKLSLPGGLVLRCRMLQAWTSCHSLKDFRAQASASRISTPCCKLQSAVTSSRRTLVSAGVLQVPHLWDSCMCCTAPKRQVPSCLGLSMYIHINK